MEKLQTVILAGGKGTRLRPITANLPKPCVCVLSKSVLYNILLKLSKSKIKSACLTTMYKKEKIYEEIRGIDFIDISCSEENVPLGTAGGVKNALCGKEDFEDVLVMSGDGICDFDLESIYSFHKEKNSDVTIVTTHSKNPLEYGIVLSDKDGKISRFCEKPPWAHVFSDTVNTGIYIIKRRILDFIPKDTPYDFSNDLFPYLLKENFRLFSYCAEGYWCDIGDIGAYYRCNMDALQGKIEDICTSGGKLYAKKEKDCEYACFVHDSAKIFSSDCVGPNSIICENVQIEKDAFVSHSVICKGAKIGKGCKINGAIICEGALIEDNCVIMSGCVVGSNCRIEKGVRIAQGVKVFENKIVKEGVCLVDDVIFENEGRELFSDNGIYAYFVDSPNPSKCAKAGACIASALCKEKKEGERARIAVMSDGSFSAQLAADSLLCGIGTRNVKTYDLGSGFEAQAGYFAISLMSDLVLFCFTKEKEVYIKLFAKNSLCVSRQFERKIEAEFLSNDKFENSTGSEKPRILTGVSGIYEGELLRFAKEELDTTLEDISLSFTPEREENCAKETFRNIFCELSGRIEENSNLILEISKDARELCIWEGEAMYDRYHIMALLLMHEAQKDEPYVAVSDLSPKIYRQIFGKKQLFEYEDSPAKDISISPAQMKSLLWTNDMCFAAFKLFALMKRTKKSLYELTSFLPQFEIYTEDIEKTKDDIRAKTMTRLCAHSKTNDTKEGVCICFDEGLVTVVPKRAGGFKVISEAVSFEAAKEIFSKVKEDICEKEKS